MARPERRDADYFPFYAKDGRTLFLLESKYQCKGTGFFTNVMRFLTMEENHHFCIADETDLMYFFSKCFCDEESGMDMLSIMTKTGKIDKDLWENNKIIACQDLLDSLEDAYRKRKNNIITMEEIRNSGGRNPVKGGSKPQRKGKETKGKETKIEAGEIIQYLNKKTGKKFSDISFIIARLNDGKTTEECLKIIDNQSKDEHFITNPKYMNPQTLFRPMHFDKYLNNTPKPKKESIPAW